jgi:hypothetical protein
LVAFDSDGVATCDVYLCSLSGYQCGPIWPNVDARVGDTDGDRAYVATGTEIRSCALGEACSGADAGALVVPSQANVLALALGSTAAGGDTKMLYWVDGDGGALMSSPTTGGSPVTLATGQNTASRIAVDGLVLYVLNTGTGTDGELVRVDTTDGGVTLLASRLVRPVDLVVGGKDVYWTNAGAASGAGTVMRVPK